MVKNTTEKEIRKWLEEVMDPEIPVLSLVDLGVVGDIQLHEEGISVEIRPTFVGCPATNQMKYDVESLLHKKGFDDVNVEVSYKSPWNSDMITDKGREALRKFGYAPPPKGHLIDDIDVLEHAECPRCGGTNTELQSAFGPTLCRSMHYCNDCLEAFQQFKALDG